MKLSNTPDLKRLEFVLSTHNKLVKLADASTPVAQDQIDQILATGIWDGVPCRDAQGKGSTKFVLNVQKATAYICPPG